MLVVPITPYLVRVDGWLRERYAVRSGNVWTWDVTGRAVCPVTADAIHAALKARS